MPCGTINSIMYGITTGSDLVTVSISTLNTYNNAGITFTSRDNDINLITLLHALHIIDQGSVLYLVLLQIMLYNHSIFPFVIVLVSVYGVIHSF